MQLSLSDLTALPLRAALIERQEQVVASTPEWGGDGPATVMYPVRNKHLHVSTRPADPAAQRLLDELLDVLESAQREANGEHALRVRMLAASLRLLAGSYVVQDGDSADVVELARAGIRARTSLTVDISAAEHLPVRAVEAVALVLVQLAVNAQRHGAAQQVTLAHDRTGFHVRWPSGGHTGRVRTARRHADRARWGMGFGRIAADALGGTVHPPLQTDPHTLTSTFELGIGRLALPLALVRRETVLRSTRAWEEETAASPGVHIDSLARLAAAVRAARRQPGVITVVNGWSARATGDDVWIAIPPDDVGDRMLDILDGLVHEHVLLHGLSAATQVRIHGLAVALGACLGRPMSRVPMQAWTRRMRALQSMLPPTVRVPAFDGIGALDPDVVTTLASRVGRSFAVADGCLYLEVRDDMRDDVMLRALAPPDATRIRIG